MAGRFFAFGLFLAVMVHAVVGQACTPLADAAAQGNLTGLIGALSLAGSGLESSDEGKAVLEALSLSNLLPSDNRVTVFAPSNEAFQAALQALSAPDGALPPTEEIAAVILNHVVPGDLTSETITSVLGQAGGSVVITTLLESELFVSTQGDSLFVQPRGLVAPGAAVLATDIPTCVGPVHVIDKVLLPLDENDMMTLFPPEAGSTPADNPTGPVEPQGCSTVAATATQAGLQALLGAVTAETERLQAKPLGPEFLAALSQAELVIGDGVVTIFAPTDDAFTAAADKFGGTLPESEVADVLLNHAVLGNLTAAAITSRLGSAGGPIVVQTLLGSEMYVTASDAGVRIQSRGLDAPGALVVIPDVMTCVGPVHVVDAVLLPTLPDGSEVKFANETTEGAGDGGKGRGGNGQRGGNNGGGGRSGNGTPAPPPDLGGQPVVETPETGSAGASLIYLVPVCIMAFASAVLVM